MENYSVKIFYLFIIEFIHFAKISFEMQKVVYRLLLNDT